MWMLMGLMGLLMASSVADAFVRFENGNRGVDDDDTADAESAFGSDAPTGGTAAGGDLLSPQALGEGVEQDPWLDEWRDDDGFVSRDDGDVDGDDGTEQAPPRPGPETPPPDSVPVSDPWLDGWRDDSYLSQDDAPADPAPEEPEPGVEPEPDTTEPAAPDPWLDGWRDDSYLSSDIPGDLAALAGGAQAVHVLGAGDVFDTGGGFGAFVIGDWIGDGAPATIESFDPATDRLIFAFDAALGPPQITVAPGDGSIPAVLMIDDHPVLSMTGVQTLDAGSVLLYPVRLDS